MASRPGVLQRASRWRRRLLHISDDTPRRTWPPVRPPRRPPSGQRRPDSSRPAPPPPPVLAASPSRERPPPAPPAPAAAVTSAVSRHHAPHALRDTRPGPGPGTHGRSRGSALCPVVRAFSRDDAPTPLCERGRCPPFKSPLTSAPLQCVPALCKTTVPSPSPIPCCVQCCASGSCRTQDRERDSGRQKMWS